MSASETSPGALIDLTADIVAAHVGYNQVALGDLPGLITAVYASLAGLGVPVDAVAAEPVPAVPIKRSVRPDYLVCLEDGKQMTMLKRYLMTRYQMTPEQYRVRWNLRADYPMVAPNYAEKRRILARKIGLGRKPSAEKPTSAPKKAAAPRRKLSIASPKG